MKSRFIFVLFYVSSVWISSLFAQSLSNLRSIQVDLDTITTVTDTLSIIPNTVKIVDAFAPSDSTLHDCYHVENTDIIIDRACVLGGSLVNISYRVFSVDLEGRMSLIDSTQIQTKDKLVYIGYDYSPTQTNLNKVIAYDKLAYDGNFTRGFSVGNSQSLVLNSNFNLQLNGDLGDDMVVQAAISDDNLPIQAEGNTQLLQEFDKVFIKVKKDRTSIIAGDYDLRSPQGYFVNYFKKLKGLQLSNESAWGPYQVSNTGNFAISRGKFARNILPTREGNQGPYKLLGNEGERILKVLSGTEKVYLDGKLIKRGLDYDYIISYDRSEILFTTNLLVTKDIRIIVEFEYADQNYLRSQYSVASSMRTDNLEVNFNIYNEQDSKTTTGDIDLDNSDISILAAAGDDFSRTIRSGIVPSTTDFSQEQNYYNRIFEPSIQDSILVFTADPDSARYIVTFSDVGLSNGSYAIDPLIAANGRAYSWVGPNQGSFEPIVRLIPPERKQMISINAKSQVTKTLSVTGEVAMSNVDLNRFSDVDQGDNLGIASKLGAQHNLKLGTTDHLTLQTYGDYEFVQDNFTALNPFRAAEFIRDWSVDLGAKSNEHIYNFGAGIADVRGNNIAYSLGGYIRENNYQGMRHKLDLSYQSKGYKVVSMSSMLTAQDQVNDISFFRPNLRLEKTFQNLKNWTVGFYYEKENNQTDNLNNQELTTSSFDYTVQKYYINKTDNQRFRLGLSYLIRKDRLPSRDQLLQATTANQFEFLGKWHPSDQSQLDWNFAVRSLSIDDVDLTTQSAKRSYLGRVDYKLKALHNGIRSTTSYIVSSGQEAKAEFEYIRVEKGEGQYIWLDDGDGVEEVFEFQLSPVQDTANFIRVNIINNDFIRTLTNSVNQSLRIDIDDILGDQRATTKFNRFMSRFSTISSFRIAQKSEDSDTDNVSFQPFSFSSNDTTLVSYSSLINNTVFFNRGDPIYDVQLGNRNNRNKQVFVTGFEANGLRENFARLRLNLKRNIDFILGVNQGENSLDSENFDQNDYQISFLKAKPELTIRPNQEIRFVSSYEYIHKSNEIGGDRARSHDFTLNTSWRRSNLSSLEMGLSFILVDYDGMANSNIELAMLEGLKDGENYIWNMNYSRKLSKYVEMLISYEGRKTGIARTIHTGRAQVKANF